VLLNSVRGSLRSEHSRSLPDLLSDRTPLSRDSSFGPATLTVPVGTVVTWTNRDDIPHTVVSTDESKTFKSKVLDTDEKFYFTFNKRCRHYRRFLFSRLASVGSTFAVNQCVKIPYCCESWAWSICGQRVQKLPFTDRPLSHERRQPPQSLDESVSYVLHFWTARSSAVRC
jgi:hypothetical protein